MISVRNAKIAEAVISGRLIGDVATDHGVTERQVYRILAKPGIRSILDAAARGSVRAATLALQQGSRSSAGALVQIARDPKLPAAARVSAAGRVLELALKAVELDDLEGRITELEAAAERTKAPTPFGKFP